MHYRPPFSHRANAHRVAHRAFGLGGFGNFGALPSTPLEFFKQLKKDIETAKAEVTALNGQLKMAKSNLVKAQGALLKCESSSLAGFRGGFGQLSGSWEDWCAAGGADSKYGGRMRVCLDNSIPCNISAPWTAAGMACRFSKYGANPLNIVSEVVSFVAPTPPPSAPVIEESSTPSAPAAPVCTSQSAVVVALETAISIELPTKIAAASEKLKTLTALVPEAQAEAQKQLDMEAAREAALEETKREQTKALEEAKREQTKLLKQEQRKETLQKSGNTALKVGGVAAAAFVLKMLLF